MEKADYGSYISRIFIVILLAIGATAFVLLGRTKKRAARIILGLTGVVSLLVSAFFVSTNISHKDSTKLAMRDSLLELLPWEGEGKALDIGTGSGLLAIGIAGKFPDARVVGTDIWKWTGGSGLDKKNAEKNARAEGVGDRVIFEFGDAREMPFEDASFDAVVTNLVWHNIPVLDRFRLVQEALRLLKPGGAFLFSDLFKSKISYGDFSKLKSRLDKEVTSYKVKDASSVEGLKMGKACVLYGRK